MIYLGGTDGIKGHKFMRKTNTVFLGTTAKFDEKLFPHNPDHNARTPTFTTEGDESPSTNLPAEDNPTPQKEVVEVGILPSSDTPAVPDIQELRCSRQRGKKRVLPDNVYGGLTPLP